MLPEFEFAVDYSDLIQPITLIILTMTGWGVKAIWSRVCAFDKNLSSLRAEIHAELQEYERKEACRAHREAIGQRIDTLSAVHGMCMTKHGLGIVNINDAKQMHELHEILSPSEREAHAAKCQFKEDMHRCN